jgi:hypothetical protein
MLRLHCQWRCEQHRDQYRLRGGCTAAAGLEAALALTS